MSKDWTAERQASAGRLLEAVNALMSEALGAGVMVKINPKTGSQVSGKTYGGFRPQSCTEGAPNSSHKEGSGVDVYDPAGELDVWLMKNVDRLVHYGLYIEHPSKTLGWCHLTTRAPRSGNRIFFP